jgi:hypothetical protein
VAISSTHSVIARSVLCDVAISFRFFIIMKRRDPHAGKHRSG